MTIVRPSNSNAGSRDLSEDRSPLVGGQWTSQKASWLFPLASRSAEGHNTYFPFYEKRKGNLFLQTSNLSGKK